MGKWKLEACRFLLYVTFPVATFWAFNQPFFYDYAINFFSKESPSAPLRAATSAQITEWKEQMREERKREAQEKILLEKMAFEEARRFRERHSI